ncbi:hypothetical protein [Haloarchaeobius salinus]|uniref:hypothetical protein n=1 Tax=Haloarchaeobius salinus TaxID=1198298 RepID=UPI00210AD1A9|nr:hypothetical protein [Haloarchaeobius salinus]
MEVTLGPAVLEQYDRLSLYNSPYPAHDAGNAVDCYPGDDTAPSPVAGTVRGTVTVRAPPRDYADEEDHLLLVDVDVEATPALSVGGGESTAPELVARIMHVDSPLDPGTRIAVGDDLGDLVFPGFFGPWVDPHLHVGFRRPEQHLHRASGSLPLVADVPVEAVPWDGVGEVVATGDTWAMLDAPGHPAPGRFVGLEATDSEGAQVVLDGGFRHYDCGGLFDERGSRRDGDGPVTFLGERVGVAEGRTVRWDDVAVRANGQPVHGLSLFLARDAGFGAKLVCPDHEFAVGEPVTVTVDPA